MTQHSGDRSVSIGGNADVSGQIATGDNVVQRQHIGGEPAAGADVAAALDRVAELLDRHTAELGEVEGRRARRDLDDVREEADAEEPDEERLEGALGRLGRRVSGVAVLAEAVRQLTTQLGLG